MHARAAEHSWLRACGIGAGACRHPAQRSCPELFTVHAECCGTAGVASSLKGFNPLDDIEEGAGAPAAAAAPAAGASVAW